MKKLTLLNFFTVLRCSACDEIFKLGKEGNAVLCDECNSKFETEKQRCCASCGLVASLCRCIPKNIRSVGCNTLIKIGFYDPENEGITERLILDQKDNLNKQLSRFLAEQLSIPIRAYLISSKKSFSDVIITYAPRSRKAVNEKGFDQAEIMAKLCAENLGCRFERLLTRSSGGKQQKELDSSARIENAKRTFELKRTDFSKKSTIVIVDDIVTTGASLSACVALLKNAGVENIVCLTVAQTNKKSHNSSERTKR